MWALRFVRIGKIVSENANQFSCNDYFTGEFSSSFNLKNMTSAL
jgi:hypothetical protein